MARSGVVGMGNVSSTSHPDGLNWDWSLPGPFASGFYGVDDREDSVRAMVPISRAIWPAFTRRGGVWGIRNSAAGTERSFGSGLAGMMASTGGVSPVGAMVMGVRYGISRHGGTGRIRRRGFPGSLAKGFGR